MHSRQIIYGWILTSSSIDYIKSIKYTDDDITTLYAADPYRTNKLIGRADNFNPSFDGGVYSMNDEFSFLMHKCIHIWQPKDQSMKLDCDMIQCDI